MDTFDAWAGRAVDVDVAGLRVAAHDDGPADAATLTFLHGFPSSSHDVLPLLERVPELRVVAVDLPGFGASAKPLGHRYSIHGAADAAEAAWARFGVSATVLVAHDYGVSVAQELLARQQLDGRPRPTRVTGVVWMNGGLYSDLHRPTAGQQLLLDPEHGPALAAAVDEASFRGGIEVTWGQRRPLGDQELHDMWCSMARDGGMAQAHQLLQYVADRREHGARWIAALESCPLPMQFVWGELDPVSGSHVADRLAERLPSVPLHRLLDVGHWPPLEAPDELAAAVREVATAAG